MKNKNTKALITILMAFMLHACAGNDNKKSIPSIKATNTIGDVSSLDVLKSIDASDLTAIERFIALGNDIDQLHKVSNKKNYTLLCRAIRKDKSNKIAKFLLTKGANPNSECSGKTPLMYAAKYKNHNMIEELVGYKADVNYESSNGMTALGYAIQKNNVKGLILLLQYGADPNRKIKQVNMSAYSFAKKKKNKQILEVLSVAKELLHKKRTPLITSES